MTAEPAPAPMLDLESGLWQSVSEIARAKQKSRQAIAKRVKSLVDDGKLTTKPGPRGTVLVNVAAFDRLVGEVADVAREIGAETKAEQEATGTAANGKFRDAATREKQYSADIKFLDLEERLGRLVPIGELEDAAAKAAEAMIRVIDRLPAQNERVSGAVGKDGPAGARTVLKEIARELRASIAEAMTTLANLAGPATIDTSLQSMAMDEPDGAS